MCVYIYIFVFPIKLIIHFQKNIKFKNTITLFVLSKEKIVLIRIQDVEHILWTQVKRIQDVEHIQGVSSLPVSDEGVGMW